MKKKIAGKLCITAFYETNNVRRSEALEIAIKVDTCRYAHIDRPKVARLSRLSQAVKVKLCTVKDLFGGLIGHPTLYFDESCFIGRRSSDLVPPASV